MRLGWSRRTFIKAAGAATVGSLVPLAAGRAAEGAPRVRVVVAQSKDKAGKSADLGAEEASRLADEAVKSLTGAKTPAEGWKTLFKPGDRVAVKVNTLAGSQLSTHPSVAAAVVAGLLSAGVPAGQIVVFDRSERELSRAGYEVATKEGAVRFAGTDSRGFGYTQEILFAGAVGSLWSRVITDFATAIVNVPVLKDHDLSGVSLGMKNFFGVIHNPNKYHDSGCDPYIADLSVSPLIRKRLRLVVIDALRAQVDGGPAYRQDGAYPYAGLVIGTDPVATDAVGWREIETIRRQLKFKPLEEVGRQPKHIFTAAKKGLGEADRERIDVVRLSV